MKGNLSNNDRAQGRESDSTRILLVDNGSRRADATLALRRLGEQLAARLARPVDPVSLLHSSAVPAQALGGRPAETLEPYLMHQVASGIQQFLAVPLLFGRSRALTSLIPQTVERVSQSLDRPIRLEVAAELCPLPQGEPRLASILDRAIRDAIEQLEPRPGERPNVILVDHGSPIPEVTEARRWLGARLGVLAQGDYLVQEAAMERRPGPEYAFNGDLLEEALDAIAARRPQAQVVVAMQFIGPGRHAGEGGDVAEICQAARDRHPGVRIQISRLVGEDESLVDILADRAEEALAASWA
jgi:sirohydrochlorin ferrochelatase